MSARQEVGIRSREHTLDCSDVVRFRSTVVYQELPAGASRRVTLVDPRESDASAGRISSLSPIGRALLGLKKGNVAYVDLPMGRTIAIRITDVIVPALEDIDEPSYA